MLKKSLLIACILLAWLMLCSIELDWGVKYGAGISSIHGKNLNYSLHYDFQSILNDTLLTDAGYLKVKSNKQKPGFAQTAGLFFIFPLAQGENKLLFQPEINWQRYAYSYWFKGSEYKTDNFMLAWEFPGHVGGFVDNKLDYLNVPLLLKMQTNGTISPENEAINSAYAYMGPAVSVLVSNKTTFRGEISGLDNHVNTYVANSLADADTTQYYSVTKLSNAAEEPVSLKYDLVFGFGFNLQNVLKLGLGKDEWVLDTRFNLNLNPLGDFSKLNNYKLYSALVSVGYKF